MPNSPDVILVLSNRAGQALLAKLNEIGAYEDETEMDLIQAIRTEVEQQLARAPIGDADVVSVREPEPNVAEQVADKMAKSARKAVEG